MNLRLLIDINLSPAWVERFAQDAFDAVHWSAVGDARASDTVVMAYARDNGFAVFTHDLDLSTILALTKARGPSVVQVRTQDVTPEHIGGLVIDTIRAHVSALLAGAVLTIDEASARVRILPLT